MYTNMKLSCMPTNLFVFFFFLITNCFYENFVDEYTIDINITGECNTGQKQWSPERGSLLKGKGFLQVSKDQPRNSIQYQGKNTREILP